jgi:hypothetical protein
MANTQIMETIKKYMKDNFIDVTGSRQELQYNIAAVFYNAQNNYIADVWRNILPKETYEIFSYCEKKGEPKIKVRMVPFGDPESNVNDWANLDIYIISPINLIAYDLEQNDENVYTYFASYIIGSPRERGFYLAAAQLTHPDARIMFDPNKVGIYGFKPLEINYMGYDRSRVENVDENSTATAIQRLNKLAAYWYSRNEEMYSGSITLITDFVDPDTNPRVGCRAAFLGGEFYINKTENSWTYGSAPTIKLSVTRGLVYENGLIKNYPEGVIQDIGGNYKELDENRWAAWRNS